ncbi:MAG: hypothetical protein GY810_14280 [Aureispira sp.]|nr:hypothetical protein [Aureispira sp.]
MKHFYILLTGLAVMLFMHACDWANEIDDRTPFLGIYEVEEIQYNHATLDFDTTYYEMEITMEETEDVVLNGLGSSGVYSTGCTITATVGGLRLVIPNNLCDFGNGVYYEFTGSGTLDDNHQELVISLDPRRCQQQSNSVDDCRDEQAVSIHATKQ